MGIKTVLVINRLTEMYAPETRTGRLESSLKTVGTFCEDYSTQKNTAQYCTAADIEEVWMHEGIMCM
jgi:hypothetical protein